MYVLMIVFIAVVLVIGIFCVAVVSRDIVIEEREKKKAQPKAEEPEAAATVVPEEPVSSAVVLPAFECEEPVVTEAEEEVVNDGKVAFSAVSKTLDEKYLELSPEFKGYYDEIVRYAMNVEGSKRFKNAAYEEYKVGKSRLVRLKIRRDTIICEFVIPNLAFKNYISDNKVSVKQAPAAIKVTDEAALSAVKDSISIAVKAIEEEKAYKKEQAKLRRKKKREEAAGAVADER